MSMNATIQLHDQVLAASAAAPSTLILVTDTQVKTGGNIWRGTHAPSADISVSVIALTTRESWAEVSWEAPSTAVGVQFAGNQDDGWARILVNGEVAWQGNTYGDNGHFNQYVEVAGLPDNLHTVRVEVIGQAGTDSGGIDVSIAAFGLGSVSSENKATNSSKIYTPLVFGNNASE